jgi:hypothetical protein
LVGIEVEVGVDEEDVDVGRVTGAGEQATRIITRRPIARTFFIVQSVKKKAAGWPPSSN